MDDNIIKSLLVGGFGAFLQELLHWYNLRLKLSSKRYIKMVKNYGYWAIVILMIISGGISTYIWFSDSFNDRTLKEFLVFGFAFPLILKKAGDIVAYRNINDNLGKNIVQKTKESIWSVYLGLPYEKYNTPDR